MAGMDVIVKIAWPSGDIYYSKYITSVGNQSILPILKSISPLTTGIDIFTKSFTSTQVNIVLDDSNNEFTQKLNGEDKVMNGIDVYIFPVPTDNLLDNRAIRKLFFLDKSFDEINNDFAIIASDSYNEVNSDYLGIITKDQWPNRAPESEGQVIQEMRGISESIETGTVLALRVDNTGNKRYLLNYTGGGAGSPVTSLQRVSDPDDNDITAGLTIITDGDYQYIDYTASNVDFLKVNCTAGSVQPHKQTDAIFNSWNFAQGDTGSSNIQLDNMVNYMNVPNIAYVMDENLKGKELVQIGTGNINVDWWLNQQKILEYSFYDQNNPPVSPPISGVGITGTILTGDIISFNYVDEEAYIKNRIIGKHSFKNTDSKFRRSLTVVNQANKSDSQSLYGINSIPEDEYKYYNEDIPVYNVAKYKQIMFDRPVLFAVLQVNLKREQISDSDVNIDYTTGKFIQFKHPKAITSGYRKYRVVNRSIDFDGNVLNYTLQDLGYLEDLDTDTKLLINPDTFNNSQEIWNSSAGGYMQFVNNGVFYSDVQTMLNPFSERYNGSSYLVNDPNTHATSRADFDLADTSNTANFTMFGFFRFDSLGNTEFLYDQYANGGADEIFLIKRSANDVRFRITIASAVHVELTSTSILAANTWYFFAIIKKISDYGLYVNTNQEAHVFDAGNYSVSAPVEMGRRGDDSFYNTGYRDSFNITHGNPFNGNPAAGNDTIVVPVNPISWYNPAGI